MSKKRFNLPRFFTQLFFFALILMISVNKNLVEMGKGGIGFLSSASLHALCPFGGIVSIYQFTTVGTFVQKIHQSSFVLMFIVFAMAVLFGPVFCGWVCPLGTFQEWLGKIGQKLFGKRFNKFIPEMADKYLRYLRYIILVWVLYVIGISGKLVFQEYDPYFALFNFWTSEVAVTSLFILALTIVASIFVERPWCKYACPYGAVLGLTNLFRVFKIKRETSTCISCSACDRACPMNISVSASGVVKNHQCISCMSCTSDQVCPVANTVEMTTTKGGVSI
ncbi:MAG: ferredoxin [Clostridiaceae bacterium BRH_c20a]|nr:MAG: ferredoxin [Clostridiaceae bacterium BRH_c20a]